MQEINYHEQFSLQAEVLKLIALGVGYVGGLLPPVLGRQLQLALPAVQVLTDAKIRFKLQVMMDFFQEHGAVQERN